MFNRNCNEKMNKPQSKMIDPGFANQGFGGFQGGMLDPGMTMCPIYEPMQERCIHREICHEVPHVCPINTRIINHHIFKHTYTPQYTCCEENQVCNIDQGSCCGF